MSKAQFLLVLIAIIPLSNFLVLGLLQDSEKLVNIFSKLFPILFFLHLIGIFNLSDRKQIFLQIIEVNEDVSLSFMVDYLTLKFLFLFNFIWIIFVFYSHRFLRLENQKNINNFKIFFAIAISLINFIIIAQNLLTTLLFYSLLTFFCYFFARKFLYAKEKCPSNIFDFLLYFEIIFFFLAVVGTYKFFGRISFSGSIISSTNFDQLKIIVLFLLYLGGLFLSNLVPCCFLYRHQINLNPIITFSFFFLFYAFPSLYIFLKVIVFIFGLDIFSNIILQSHFELLEIIFLLNLLFSAVFLLLSKNLKSLFFYLFFNQFIFSIFAIFIFALFDQSRVYLTLYSFLLSFILVFLCLSNIILYLEKSFNKDLKGLFFNLKITSTLLLFSLLNLIGFAPTISGLEKFFLLKILFKKKLFLGSIIIIFNYLIIVIVACRLFYLFLSKNESAYSKSDIELARNIDHDSSLILTSLSVLILAILAAILYPISTNIFGL